MQNKSGFNRYFFRTLIALVCFSSLLLASCNSDSNTATSKPETYPRKPTTSEAQLFSEIFVNNYNDKNARYLAYAGTLPSKGFISRGIVDWENSIYSTDVALTKDGDTDIKSIVSKTETYETYIEIEKGFQDNGLEPRDWILRNFDPETYGNDALVQALSVLSNETAENPLLLSQNGVQVLGKDKVNDVDTTVFKGADSRIYFVSSDARMQKVVGKLSGFNAKVTLTFYERGSQQIQVPSKDAVYPVSEVENWYYQLRPNF